MNNSKLLCKTEDELYKLMSIISLAPDTFPSDSKLSVIRQLMLDYHILVSEGKVPEFKTNLTDEDRKAFKKLMQLANEMLMEDGICPMKENEDGSLSVDIDKIRNNPNEYKDLL